MKTSFPSFDFSNDTTDDDCIICNKLLVKHSEKEALRRKQINVTTP